MDDQMKNKSSGIHLFNLAGFEVRLDFSWFFLAILICWTLAVGYFPYYVKNLSVSSYWMMGAAGALGLFFSIILHELCHSLVGRNYGIPIGGITLFIFGGIAHMKDMPPSPKSEFLMAVVGPLFSIALATALLFALHIGHQLLWPEPLLAVIQYLSTINFVLGIFNMLPGFPLDGGRVFRSLLWWWKGDLKWATDIACKGGITLGYALIIFGIFQFLLGALIAGLWLFVLGFFIERISKMSYENVVIREMFQDEPIKKYTKTNPVTVSPSISLQELLENYFYKYYFKLYPVVENHQLKGCISLKEVKQIEKERWTSLKVKDVMHECSPEIMAEADSKVTKVLETMRMNRISRMIITENGELYGVISLKDLLDVISMRTTFEEGE